MRIISDAEVASLLDPAKARDYVLRALHGQAAGRAGLSTPRSLAMRPEGQASYQVKAAYLADGEVAGIRLGSTPRKGSVDGGGMRLLLLCDLGSGTPLALLAEHTMYGMRVGAAIAVTVEWLRAPGARILGVLGAGRLARPTIEALQATTPFDEVRVTSRTTRSRETLGEALAARGIRRIRPVATPEAACDGADVIVTLTDANLPLVQAAWCRPGSLLVSGGAYQECEEAAILEADRLFVDDWEQCALYGDIAALHRRGRIGPDRVAGSLADLVTGQVPGRGSARERIVAVVQGLTLLDVAFGYHVYRAAQAAGLGSAVDAV